MTTINSWSDQTKNPIALIRPLAVSLLALVSTLFVGSAESQSTQPPDDFGPTIAYHLERLAEPPMWNKCQSGKTSYRMLELSSARRTVAAVRVTRIGDAIEVKASSSDQHDSLLSSAGPVSWAEWVELEGLLDSLGFWRLGSEWNVWRPDSPVTFIEACKGGDYHVVQRHPVDFDIEDIVRLMLRLREQSIGLTSRQKKKH